MSFNGQVTVFPPGMNPDGAVMKPDGTYLNITGSVTNGLQEAINYACGNPGYDLEVKGGSLNGSAWGFPHFAPIEFPPMQGKKIRFGAISMGHPSLPYVMRFDSCEMVDFEFCGQMGIQTPTSTAGVIFAPRNGLPVDVAKQINDCRFHFQTVGCDGTFAAMVDTRASGCQGVFDNFLSFTELISGQYSFYTYGQQAGSRFSNNQIKMAHAHGAKITGIAVDGGPGILGNNEWHVCVSTEHPTTRGIDTFGSNDRWFGSIEGPGGSGYAAGLLVESVCRGNRFMFPTCEGGVENHAPAGTNIFL